MIELNLNTVKKVSTFFNKGVLKVGVLCSQGGPKMYPTPSQTLLYAPEITVELRKWANIYNQP